MNKKYLDYPVFICGHRKTGTTMLINLFDSTQDAVVYPDDSGFFYLYYPRFDSDKYTSEQKKERLADVIIAQNLKAVIEEARCNDKQRKELFEKNQRYYDLLKAYENKKFNTKDIFTYFIDCFQQSFYPEMENPKIWMEKTTSTEIYALEMAEMFPRGKFIHLIRDPRDNWASLKSGWDKRYKNYNDDIRRLKQSLLERGKLGMEMARSNMDTIGKDRYKVIRFEDFTADAESHLKDLCQFIAIEYTKDLLTPSTFGYVWEGNSFEGNKFSSVSNVNVNSWKKRIDDEEAQLIEFYFRDIMPHFGYELNYSLKDAQKAATNHYKWFNFSTPYSAK